MGKHSETQIFSIFGQIEQVAAEILIGDGTATRIEAVLIPSTVAINDLGQRAKFAIVLPRRAVARFETLIADLRA